jgi:hypothetical protein
MNIMRNGRQAGRGEIKRKSRGTVKDRKGEVEGCSRNPNMRGGGARRRKRKGMGEGYRGDTVGCIERKKQRDSRKD